MNYKWYPQESCSFSSYHNIQSVLVLFPSSLSVSCIHLQVLLWFEDLKITVNFQKMRHFSFLSAPLSSYSSELFPPVCSYPVCLPDHWLLSLYWSEVSLRNSEEWSWSQAGLVFTAWSLWLVPTHRIMVLLCLYSQEVTLTSFKTCSFQQMYNHFAARHKWKNLNILSDL